MNVHARKPLLKAKLVIPFEALDQKKKKKTLHCIFTPGDDAVICSNKHLNRIQYANLVPVICNCYNRQLFKHIMYQTTVFSYDTLGMCYIESADPR